MALTDLQKNKWSGEYEAWVNMRHHCHNPNHAAYPYYGGRGATVCKEWLASFEQFITDVGPRPTKHHLMRIDKSLPYQKGNVKWASRKECHRNRINSRPPITINGVTKTPAAWAEESGIDLNVIMRRIEAKTPEHLILYKGDLRKLKGWRK